MALVSTTSHAKFEALDEFPCSESQMITPPAYNFQDEGNNAFFDLSTNYNIHENFIYDEENYSPYLSATSQAENEELPFSSPPRHSINFGCQDLESTKCLKRQRCYDHNYPFINYDLATFTYDRYAQDLSPLQALELSSVKHKTCLGGYETWPFGENTSSCDQYSCCKLLDGRLIYPTGDFFLELSATLPPPERFLVCPDSPSTKNPPLLSSRKSSDNNGVAAQSIAARRRRRRRKITEKTRELSKLIPGGAKKNIAQMLQAAFNYVKFMQAQVGILESVGSFEWQEEEEAKYKNYEEAKRKLQALVTSPTIKEKLYSKGRCLAPTHFVEALAKVHHDDHHLHSISSSAMLIFNHSQSTFAFWPDGNQ